MYVIKKRENIRTAIQKPDQAKYVKYVVLILIKLLKKATIVKINKDNNVRTIFFLKKRNNVAKLVL
jgi:hypothetical protein